MEPTDIAKAAKLRRDANDAVLKDLIREVDERAERTKLVLTVLHAAAIPFDLLTSEVLDSLSCGMGGLIHASEEDE